mmetsp:Transcript_46364/g.77224  ORF Transcript_46364/g.77224 Transcript_46364/m.77224 type:complete len:470 (+) Transcript_46364:32-1441(+)
MCRRSSSLTLAAALLLLLTLVHARIDKLQVSDDSRKQIYIEQFGFFDNAHVNFKVSNLKVEWPSWPSNEKEPPRYKLGILMSAISKDPYAFFEQEGCLLDMPEDKKTFVSKWAGTEATVEGKAHKFQDKSFDHDIAPSTGEKTSEADLYTFFFVLCGDAADEKDEKHKTRVTFTLDLTNENPNGNFLSAGESPLPWIYIIVSVQFIIASGVWSWAIVRNRANTHRIHILMSILIALKIISLILESARWHALKIGTDSAALDTAYYIFYSLKATMLFLVILLIGTGWSLVKPFLSGREKKVVIVCLFLQVMANIANIVIGEKIPGDKSWFKWQDAFKLLDIICCCAILFPIVWSIRHLREASQSDGKAAKNLQRLKMFRHLYLVVVSYVYFTRIILPLFEPILFYTLLWIKDLLYEEVTLIFFAVVGYKFRPLSENPYIRVAEDDDEQELESTQLQMERESSARPDRENL